MRKLCSQKSAPSVVATVSYPVAWATVATAMRFSVNEILLRAPFMHTRRSRLRVPAICLSLRPEPHA